MPWFSGELLQGGSGALYAVTANAPLAPPTVHVLFQTYSPQLHIFGRTERRWVQVSAAPSLFNPSYPTAVFVHGWNSTAPSLLHWDGDLNQNSKEQWHPWREMAIAIHDTWTPEVNLLAWDWLAEATALVPPAHKVHDQAQRLALQLATLFEARAYGNDTPLHLLGHSLGAHLVAWAATNDALYTRERNGRRLSRVDQLTYFDPVGEEAFRSYAVLSDICNPTRTLREDNPTVHIDIITGITSMGAHRATLYINPPPQDSLLNHDTFNWYKKTITQGKTGLMPCLFPPYSPHRLSDTIGFATSVVLRDANLQAPAPTILPGETIGFTTGSHFRVPGCTDPDFTFTQRSPWHGSCTCRVDDPACHTLVLLDLITVKATAPSSLPSDAFIGVNFFQFRLEHSNSTPAFLDVHLTSPRGNGGGAGVAVEAEFPLLHLTLDSGNLGPLVVAPIGVVNAFAAFDALQLRLQSTDTTAEVLIRDFTLIRDQGFGNMPPVAAAGPDQLVEVQSSGMAAVQVSAEQSVDPEGGNLGFLWRLGQQYLGDAPLLEVELSLGEHEITLSVVDDFNALDTDVIHISVVTGQPGDGNRDGTVDLSDAVYVLGCLFLGTDCPLPNWIGDYNCDRQLDLSDPIFLLSYLFLGTQEPEPCP